MNRIYYLILVTLFNTNVLFGEYQQSTIDTVYHVKWGYGQNQGQSPEYFPANIFGKPDSNANRNIPTSSPYEICSIGLDGEIIVGFKNFLIFDGPGPDFTIFENAFINPVTNKVFAEPAEISVSYDGVHFYSFPFDSLNLKGCAGITPTNGAQDCFNPEVSGGDKFDLAEIGIQQAKYIKIRDVTNLILSNSNHPYYDPILSGFDLDAVVGLNLLSEHTFISTEHFKDNPEIKTAINLIAVSNAKKSSRILILDVLGRIIKDVNFSYNTEVFIDVRGFVLILVFEDGIINKRLKIML